MTENLFGRRHRRAVPEIEPEVEPPGIALMPVLGFMLAISVLIGGAAYAGSNWNTVLSVVKPSMLETVSVTANTRRAFPYWDASMLDAKHMGNIAHTLMDFHEICGNSQAREHWGNFYNGLELTAADQDDAALYRPDVYDQFALRDDVLKRVSADKDGFCAREYWQAYFDARVLADMYLDVQKQPMSVAKIPAAAPPRQERVDGRPLEPNFNVDQMCSGKWPNNYSMQEYCIKNEENARSWSRTAMVDDDVRRNCAGKWPQSWTMFQYCSNNEQQAKDRLGR